MESQRSIVFFNHLDPEEDPMDFRFIGDDVQFVELEEAVSLSFNVGAPIAYRCVVVLWVGLFFAEKFLGEVATVAVHAGYAWLGEGLCNIVDDLIIQP